MSLETAKTISKGGGAYRKRQLRIELVVLLLLGLLTAACDAVITSDEPGSHHTTPGEPAFGANLDGVALLGPDWPEAQQIEDRPSFCSGSLITDWHLLTAAHCYDSDGDRSVDVEHEIPEVAAFELEDRTVILSTNSGEDGWGPPTIRFPDEWSEFRADVAVLELREAAPAEIPRYPLYGGINELGRRFVLAGYGLPGNGATGQDDIDFRSVKRAGLNRFEDDVGPDPYVNYLAYDFDSGLEENNALAQTGFDSDLGFGADEVLMANGDSGSPNFIAGVIAGVSVFTMRLPSADVNGEDDSSWGEAGFALRISKFRDFILDATGNAALFIPDGDFDHDGLLTPNDIDMLAANMNGLGYEEKFDLDLDQIVGDEDHRIWVEDFVGTLFGDADLNKTVDFADFLALSSSFGTPGGWAEGDFDGNGAVAFADFLLLSSNFGETVMDLTSVPEPIGWISLWFVLLGLATGRKRRI